MSKFNVGDLIETESPGSELAIIVTVLLDSRVQSSWYEIKMTDGSHWHYPESSLQAIYPVTPPPQFDKDPAWGLFNNIAKLLLNEDEQVCDHQWVDYFGLNEQYRYCKKCDKKEGQL